jgi:hypothetical protein
MLFCGLWMWVCFTPRGFGPQTVLQAADAGLFCPRGFSPQTANAGRTELVDEVSNMGGLLELL